MDIPTVLQYGRDALDVIGAGAALYLSGQGAAAKVAPFLVDRALDLAFAHPAVGRALVKFRPQIEVFFDAVDKGIKERLDQAAAATPAAPPTPGA